VTDPDLTKLIDEAYKRFIEHILDQAFQNAIVEKFTHDDAVIMFRHGLADAEIMRVRLKAALEEPG
jgi:hypothetical protein